VSNLVVYCPEDCPRIQYTFDLMFGFLTAIPYELVFSKTAFLDYEGPKLNYGPVQLTSNEIFIPAGTILFEKNIVPQPIQLFPTQGLVAFFEYPQPSADFSFDLPGLIFYLATRYEEYLPFSPDQWGRFTAQQSCATKGGFLDLPLAECWMMRLIEALKAKFPTLEVQAKKYRFEPTYDIDIAWAFQQRPLFLHVASSLKDLVLGRWSSLQARWRTWTHQQKDPFYSFDYLQALHERHHLQPLFFFLLANRKRHDPNISHRNPVFRRLIQQIAAWGYVCGIHPSLASNQFREKVQIEKKRLEEILQTSVTTSRQHFLLLHFPDTYRQLLEVGIEHDYTMGYANAVGFRASISQPYPWYDLEKEAKTALMIHPFLAMDVTLKKYLGLTPNEAVERVQKLITSVKEVNGVAGILWHNSSFAPHEGWAGWQVVYEAILVAAVSEDESI